jgi:hypothetical protein
MALSNATGLWSAAALSGTPGFCAGAPGEARIDPEDRRVLRELAARVAELAARPLENEKRELWRRHNDLQDTRPLVFCDPENGWNEIIAGEQLSCRGPLARRWEMVLRKEIYWGQRLQDDKVIEPVFDIGYTCDEEDWGFQVQPQGGAGGAYVWEPVIKEEADIERLHAPTLRIDQETTRATVEAAQEAFGDLLQVRLTGVWWWSLGMTLDLSLLRGLEGIMLDMIDRPHLVHRLMAILRDGNMKKLDYLEANGLLCSNTDRYVGSGGFGYTRQLPERSGPARTAQMWGFGESQETVGISPQMFAEFILPYQLPLLERFGLNCYGCCEPLDARWHVVRQVPRLRRVSVSAWADLAKMAAQLEDRYIFSYKAPPSDLAVPQLNEEVVRGKLRRALEAARGCRVELLMKDNHTLGGNPQNAIRWVQIARQEAERAEG